MSEQTVAETAVEAAERYGREFATQVLGEGHHTPIGHYSDGMELPDGDYVELRRQFGEVTRDMEKAYRRGFNATVDES